jgi:hypothetical protein
MTIGADIGSDAPRELYTRILLRRTARDPPDPSRPRVALVVPQQFPSLSHRRRAGNAAPPGLVGAAAALKPWLQNAGRVSLRPVRSAQTAAGSRPGWVAIVCSAQIVLPSWS